MLLDKRTGKPITHRELLMRKSRVVRRQVEDGELSPAEGQEWLETLKSINVMDPTPSRRSADPGALAPELARRGWTSKDGHEFTHPDFRGQIIQIAPQGWVHRDGDHGGRKRGSSAEELADHLHLVHYRGEAVVRTASRVFKLVAAEDGPRVGEALEKIEKSAAKPSAKSAVIKNEKTRRVPVLTNIGAGVIGPDRWLLGG